MQDWANTKEISKQKTLIRILKKVTNFINSPNRSILIVDKSLYSEFAKTYRNSSTHTFIKVNIK